MARDPLESKVYSVGGYERADSQEQFLDAQAFHVVILKGLEHGLCVRKDDDVPGLSVGGARER